MVPSLNEVTCDIRSSLVEDNAGDIMPWHSDGFKSIHRVCKPKICYPRHNPVKYNIAIKKACQSGEVSGITQLLRPILNITGLWTAELLAPFIPKTPPTILHAMLRRGGICTVCSVASVIRVM